MKKLIGTIFILVIALILSSGFHKTFGQSQNYDPVSVINQAFDEYQIVAIGEEHESPEFYSLYSSLLNDKGFVKKVNVIVFEVANAIHQSLLDDYIFGKNVSTEQLSKVWRDATNSGAQSGDSPFYIDFFQQIRLINEKLALEEKIRVLAGDPPLNWDNIITQKELIPFIKNRDRHYGELVIKEVIDKKLKALLIMGGAHFYQNIYSGSDLDGVNIVKMIRQKAPNSLFVVNIIDNPILKKYAYPSILPTTIKEIGNLSVSDLNPAIKLKDEIDAVINLGPITRKISPPFSHNESYYEEYLRRKKLSDVNPFEKKEIHNDADTKVYKGSIKKKLFDIAAAALEDYNRRIKLDKNAKYSDFQILESFQDQSKGLYFFKIKDEDNSDNLQLVGQWVNNWADKSPSLQIKVAISKFDDFAILEIKEF